jgi:hypothetical protein
MFPLCTITLLGRSSVHDNSTKGEGEKMRKVLGGLGVVALLAISALAVPVQAQTATGVKKAHPTPFYDATKEVTLQGTVENVLRTPSRGMLPGAHIMLATGSGIVDTHLGPFAFKGYHPISVEPGSRVSVVGVMTTVRGSQLFLARTVKVGDEEYKIRNERGLSLVPMNPAIANAKAKKTVGGAR